MTDAQGAATPTVDESSITWLEQWYHRHCNGDWEHLSRIKIETLDNPGWVVRIDLAGTEMADKPFVEPQLGPGVDGDDWLVCRVQDAVFEGYGGPAKLGAILAVFRAWCERVPKEQEPLSPEQEELIEARARIEEVQRALGPEIGPEQCRHHECPRLHVALSVFCAEHHIENLQGVGALPVLSDDGLSIIKHAID
jgi:Immunity protein 53